MDVLIFYEHKVREYPACCALKAELERRGISARICHNGGPGIWRYRIFSHPSIAVGPSALEVRLGDNWTCLNNYTDYLRGTVRYFVNLQVEQVFPDDEAAGYSIVQNPEWWDRIIYICWGEKRRRQLLQRGVPEGQTVVAGAMHLDFLSPPLSGCYYSREQLSELYGIDAAKRWILFVSSYTYADMSDGDREWLMQVRQHDGIADPLPQIQNAIERSTESRNLTLDWADRYLSDALDSIFIYRPHPSEQISPQMVRMTQKYTGRFVIISEEPLQNWLIVSDVVDLWVSTAIVDLWKIKKPCYLIHPIPPPEGFVPVTMDGGTAIQTYESFEKAHREERGSAQGPFPWKEEEIGQYYAESPAPAYRAVGDVIERLLRSERPAAIKSVFHLSSLASLHHIRQMALAFFACFRIRPSRFMPVFRRKLRRLEDTAIRDGDVFLTGSERESREKIKKAVYEFGKSYPKGSRDRKPTEAFQKKDDRS